MSAKGGYSDDDKFLLIDCVKARPVIWDVANKFYKSKDKIGEWTKVAKDMIDVTGREFTVEGVKRQWESLRRQFSNTKKRKKTGDGVEAGIEPVWRFWTPMLFIECADIDVGRISSIKIKVKKEEEIVDIVGDFDEEEEMKQNIGSPKGGLKIEAQSTPGTSKSGKGKKRKCDPDLELIEHLISQGDEEIDPHALMVQQMIQRLAKHRRQQFEFKNEIVGIVQEFEGWLIDEEETEIGEEATK